MRDTGYAIDATLAHFFLAGLALGFKGRIKEPVWECEERGDQQWLAMVRVVHFIGIVKPFVEEENTTRVQHVRSIPSVTNQSTQLKGPEHTGSRFNNIIHTLPKTELGRKIVQHSTD